MSDEIENMVRKYQTLAVLLAVLIHFMIIFTGFVTLVILRQPLLVFIITHATVQGLAIANAILGPRIYRKYLMARQAKSLNIY
ncbi:MAG: hypothetical protein QXK39_05180 [Nitrososphaerota archaeon]